MKLTAIATAVLTLSSFPHVYAQNLQPAGRVLIVAGTANVERAGKQIPLSAGSAVENGDTLSVADKSTLQVRFTDESVVALRANSQFKIENYKFDRNADTDRSVMGLLKGGMRTITGLIGKANNKNYLVQTATSTIGIRGTHFAVVSCNNDCARADRTAEANGTYGTVTDGRISVSNSSGVAEFGQQDFFYVSAPSAPPVRLLVPPAVLADRGAASRGRVTGGDGGNVNNADSRSSGANESTSPQTASISLQRTDSVAFGDGLGQVIAVRASNTSNTSSVSNVSRRIVYFFGSSGFSGPVTTDIGTNSRPLSEFGVSTIAAYAATISPAPSYSAAAGVYWQYTPPTTSFGTGYHQAFGEVPAAAQPTAGIATYNLVGNTTPTDNYGRVATYVGSNLTMNFGSQTVSNVNAISMTFAGNATMTTGNTYTMPVQSWSMSGAPQNVTINCTGCVAAPSITQVAGRFMGATYQGYAMSTGIVTNNLTGAQPNVASNVSVYAKP